MEPADSMESNNSVIIRLKVRVEQIHAERVMLYNELLVLKAEIRKLERLK